MMPSGRGTCIQSLGNSYSIPSERTIRYGRALNYRFNVALRNLLTAADLKYRSLLIASASVSKASK